MIHRYVATVSERQIEVQIEALEGQQYRVVIDGRERIVDARKVRPGLWSLVPPGGGAARLVDVDGTTPDLIATIEAQAIPVKLVEGRRAAAAQLAPRAAKGPQPVRAPMPGKVVKVMVKPGDAVKAGQGVVVIEAMKMENELKAPRDGSVVEVTVAEGAAVESGQALVTIG